MNTSERVTDEKKTKKAQNVKRGKKRNQFLWIMFVYRKK
jgi:hypothetical protein